MCVWGGGLGEGPKSVADLWYSDNTDHVCVGGGLGEGPKSAADL